MGFNRRDFLKTLGVAGLTVCLSDIIAAENSDIEHNEFNGILYDSTRCIGCQTCEVACAKTNDLIVPVDSPQTGIIRKTDEQHRTVVNRFATHKGDVYIKSQCMHCNQPACVSACLTKAMYKTKEGPVIWRGDKCMGCRYCMVSCPFDIPKFEFNSPNPKIQKCTFCYDRILEGKKPACAENCPTEAIKFGTRREMLTEARKRLVENPGVYVDQIYGEEVAGGTAFLYLSPVPFSELGVNTKLQNDSYPELSKGFLYSVPSVFVLLPPILLGIYEATKRNYLNKNVDDDE